MQQAPSFLAHAIRSAFRASRNTWSRTCLPAQCIVKKASPQLRPWASCDFNARRQFHNSHRNLADDPITHKGSLPGQISGRHVPGAADTLAAISSTQTPPATSSPSHDEHLPSHQESQRSQISKRFTNIMDALQSNIFVASRHLNDLTGYSGIEALKRDIEVQEGGVAETRRAVRDSRDRYTQAITIRSSSQREVNDLLQRKHAWSAADLERFTSLYRSDHVNEQAEAQAQDELSRAERDAEEAASKLARTILARYHEEQIWSDKIRRMSTWGTWGLMGLNIFLFLIFQVAVEPWRRKRLVKGFEEKVMEALEKENSLHATSATATTPASMANIGTNPAVEEKKSSADPSGATTSYSTASTATNISEPSSDPVLATVELIQEEPTPLSDISGAPLLSDPADSDPMTSSPSSAPSSPSSRLQGFQQAILARYHAAKTVASNMCSDTKVTITRWDLTTAVLKGVAGGAALAGLLAVAIVRQR